MRSLPEALLLLVASALYAGAVSLFYLEQFVGLDEVAGWIKNYQTLIAGILALGSALFAAALLNRQIRQSDLHEETRRKRRWQAVRTVTPLSVMAIAEYADAAGRVAAGLLDKCTGGVLPIGAATTALPEVPNDAISVLRDLAETLPPEQVQALTLLIADMQLQRSRLKDVIERDASSSLIVLQRNVETYVVDSAILMARASALYDFARWRTNELPTAISWIGVRNALQLLHVDEDLHAGTWSQIAERSGGDTGGVVKSRWELAAT